MKIRFNCKACDKECFRDHWEYKKTKNHFCSSKCAKVYRNQNISKIPEFGEMKHGLTFLNSYTGIKNRTYYTCKCDCGNIIDIQRSKFGKQQRCNKIENHKAELSPIFRGYQQISSSYWKSIIRGAKVRDLSFEINIEYVWNLFLQQDKKCALSGVNINLSKNKNDDVTASLDRIDSNLGYCVGNLQWIHKKLNVMKMNLSDSEFRDWCNKVSNHSGISEKIDFNRVLICPKKSTVKSRADVNLFVNDINELIPDVIPIIASNMDAVGCFSMAKSLSELGLMTCLHKHYKVEEYISFFNKFNKKECIFYSIGSSDNDFQKMKFVHQYCNIKNICLDVANAYIPQALETAYKVKEIIPDCILMVGNIATPDIIEDFSKCKVSILKCGIGSGGVCTTRLIAGVGIPQFSCIIDCTKEANKYGIKICSDGGCRTPGDIVKSFAAGASMVMIGSMFAGHDECEGEWEEEFELNRNEKGIPCLGGTRKKALKFYGMSSKEAMEKYSGGVAEYRASEGKCTKVPYKGLIKDSIQQILGGLRSACSYVNANTLKELKNESQFIFCQQTHNHI